MWYVKKSKVHINEKHYVRRSVYLGDIYIITAPASEPSPGAGTLIWLSVESSSGTRRQGAWATVEASQGQQVEEGCSQR